jgi:hypothetical protein
MLEGHLSLLIGSQSLGHVANLRLTSCILLDRVGCGDNRDITSANIHAFIHLSVWIHGTCNGIPDMLYEYRPWHLKTHTDGQYFLDEFYLLGKKLTIFPCQFLDKENLFVCTCLSSFGEQTAALTSDKCLRTSVHMNSKTIKENLLTLDRTDEKVNLSSPRNYKQNVLVCASLTREKVTVFYTRKYTQ